MAQALVRIEGLPAGALDAAAAFHADWLPQLRDRIAQGDESLVLIFPDPDPAHEGWRRAALADLARLAVPGRVNGLAGGSPAAVDETLDWLAGAGSITGQLLPLVDDGVKSAAETGI